ncbi:MAG: TolC family protein [Candidatus Syntrophosphaera sp.]
MKRIIILLMLFGAALLWSQEDVGVLSLSGARELALQNNASYQADLAELEAAKWERLSALGNFLPNLSLSGTWLYMDPARTVQSGPTAFTMNNDIRTFGLSLTQPIFYGGKLWQGYQMSRIAEDMALMGADASRVELLATADNLYMGVLQTQDLLSISELSVQSAELNLQIARLKQESGLISNADFLRFQSQLASNEVSLLQARTALQLSQLQLRNHLGIDYLPLVEELPDIQGDPELEILESYDADSISRLTDLALKESEKTSSSLKLLESGVEISRRSYAIAKGNFLPTINLIGSRDYEENGIDRYEFSASNQIMVTASLPLLPQLGNYADMKAAGFAHKKSLLEAQTATREIELATEAAVLNLVSSAGQIRSARLSLDYTRQVYEQLQERFRMNLASAADLLDAELMLSSARTAHSNAVYGYHKARISLMQLIGIEDFQSLDEMIYLGANI